MKSLTEAMNCLKRNKVEKVLKETGEWDNSDAEMVQWSEFMEEQSKSLVELLEGNGELKGVYGFDKYQGPYSVIHTPNFGDITMWFDSEDDTGRSFNVKVAHIGWISGDINHLAYLLNLKEIPENELIEIKENKEIITEDEESVKFTLGKETRYIDADNKDLLDELNTIKRKISHLEQYVSVLEIEDLNVRVNLKCAGSGPSSYIIIKFDPDLFGSIKQSYVSGPIIISDEFVRLIDEVNKLQK